MENSASRRTDILRDPARQEDYYRSSKAWIEDLAERNGLAGQLSVLPNDPERYPYQRLDAGFVSAYRPSEEEITELGEESIQANMLHVLKQSVEAVIGADKAEQFSLDLRRQSMAPGQSLTRAETTIENEEAGSALRTVVGRLKTRNNHVVLAGFHPNIIALPVYAAEFIDAVKQMEEANQNPSSKPFNVFDMTERIIMPINKSLVFAEFMGQPVPDVLTKFSNLSLKVPSTASSRLFGIDSELRKAINEESDNSFDAYMAGLDAKGRSALLITDPTGSTAQRITDEDGKLAGLRFRRVSPGAYDQLDRFRMAWPVTMWWDKDPKAAKWYVGAPTSLRLGSHSKDLVLELAKATGDLAGVDVYFGRHQTPLGQLAVESFG